MVNNGQVNVQNSNSASIVKEEEELGRRGGRGRREEEELGRRRGRRGHRGDDEEDLKFRFKKVFNKKNLKKGVKIAEKGYKVYRAIQGDKYYY